MKKFLNKKLTTNQARKVHGAAIYYCMGNSTQGLLPIAAGWYISTDCHKFNDMCGNDNFKPDGYSLEAVTRDTYGPISNVTCYYKDNAIIIW